MDKRNRTEIHVVDDGKPIKIELKGRTNDILIAWGWLTLSVCKRFGLSVEGLAMKMPWIVGTLQSALREETTVDLEAIQKMRKEGETP